MSSWQPVGWIQKSSFGAISVAALLMPADTSESYRVLELETPVKGISFDPLGEFLASQVNPNDKPH